MAYRVKLTAVAERDLYATFSYIPQNSPLHAERWLEGIGEAISSLAEMPMRCGLIPEASEIRADIRHLLYGRRPGMYRILFDIQEESEEGPRIRILRIQHGARTRFSGEDLAEAYADRETE